MDRPKTWDEWRKVKALKEAALDRCAKCYRPIYRGESRDSMPYGMGMVHRHDCRAR